MTTPTDPLEAAWESLLDHSHLDDWCRAEVLRHRPLIEAAAPRPAGVDVERLARAMDLADPDVSGGDHEEEDHAEHLAYAKDIARKYAALTGSEEPLDTRD